MHCVLGDVDWILTFWTKWINYIGNKKHKPCTSLNMHPNDKKCCTNFAVKFEINNSVRGIYGFCLWIRGLITEFSTSVL